MLTLSQAQTLVTETLKFGDKQGFNPLCAVVLDAGGHMIAMGRDERCSPYRPQIATGKASACIGLGVGGRVAAKIGQERPVFAASLTPIFPGGFVPVQGGVLIRSDEGAILGAIGVTGDISANDELCAVEGIKAAGLSADAGA